MKFHFPRPSESGSALVSTLLVIVVLTIIVTAFLQSMSTERQTARSYMNLYGADLAAQAGTNAGIKLVTDLFIEHPDSATVWDQSVSTTNTLPATTFLYFDPSPVDSTATAGSAQLKYRPLVSSSREADFAPTQPRNQGIVPPASAEDWININSTRFGLDGEPWIGKFPVGSAAAAVNPNSKIEVPWVNIATTPVSGSSATAGSKIVSRYAFWIEDESFRVNLNVARAAARGNNTLGKSPNEISLQGLAQSSDATKSSKQVIADKIVEIRTNLGDQFPSLPTLNQTAPSSSSENSVYANLKFSSTLHSSGLNISRTGGRRLDLNTLLKSADENTSATDLREQLDEIIAAIKASSPDFGQRFYRSSSDFNALNVSTTNKHDQIYLQKLAANIHDYIDKDSQPTIVDSDLNHNVVLNGTRPLTAYFGPGSSIPWAIGKENIPLLQETMLRVEQGPMSQTARQPSTYSILISYYLEFWNLGTEPIKVSDLGSNPTIKIYNQPGWKEAYRQNTVRGVSPSRDIEIPLKDFKNNSGAGSEVVFQPGEVTVLTNDPHVNTVGSVYLKTTASSVYVALGHQEPAITGTIPAPTSTGGGWDGYPTLIMDTRDQACLHPTTAPGADSRTEYLFSNDKGELDGHSYAIPIQPGLVCDGIFSGRKNTVSQFHFRGGALIGNKQFTIASGASGRGTPYQYGDPRATNDWITALVSPPSAGTGAPAIKPGQANFVNWRANGGNNYQSAASPVQQSSIGQPNNFFTDASATQPFPWPEGGPKALLSLASGGSPARYQNADLTSIGQLGDVYDPRRDLGGNSALAVNAPGGARTLAIGRSDAKVRAGASDLLDPSLPAWDGDPLSRSRNWAAWRLADIFSINSDLQTEGLINPNGATRDNGAALQAALEGFTFADDEKLTDSSLKNHTLTETEVEDFVKSLVDRLSDPTQLPFLERGEISELDYLNKKQFLSKTTNTLNDRGREELFRRLVEMITTRGNTFSVYSVGQSLNQPTSGAKPIVLATHAKKVTFRLTPVYAQPSLTFVPTDVTQTTQRFAKPTSYTVEILSSQSF